MVNLAELEEMEQYQLDKENLKSLEDSIKNVFHSKMDQLHMDFLDSYSEEVYAINIEENYLIRKVFEFIKQNT